MIWGPDCFGSVYPPTPMDTHPASNNSPDDESLLTKPQVAKRLNIHVRSVDNLISAKAIDIVRIGRCVRFEPAAIEAFKNSYRVNAV